MTAHTQAHALSSTTDHTGQLPATMGGTGLSSVSALSAIVADTANTPKSLTATALQSIRVNSGGTAWEAYAPMPLSGGTMTGDIQLGETAIKLDALLSADEKWSWITTSGTLGATIAVGDLCYLNNDDGRWELADANLSDGYDKQLGICLLAGNDGSATEMLVFGKVRSAAFPSFTTGNPLYLSETAGDITHTQPVTTDAAIRIVGFALTADDLMFNPSTDYIIHT